MLVRYVKIVILKFLSVFFFYFKFEFVFEGRCFCLEKIILLGFFCYKVRKVLIFKIGDFGGRINDMSF